MGEKYKGDSNWDRFRSISIAVVAGTRWLILIAVSLAVLVAATFGGLWQATVVALLGFAVPHYLTRWREIEADERQRCHELEAHERQRVREIMAEQRQQKIVVYNTFANAIYDTIFTPIQLNLLAGDPPMPDSNQITEGIMAVSKGMTMWGSDEIVKYYVGFVQRVLDPEAHKSGTDIFDEFADLFLVLRRDIGYDNEGIERPELRRMFGLKVRAVPDPPVPAATDAS